MALGTLRDADLASNRGVAARANINGEVGHAKETSLERERGFRRAALSAACANGAPKAYDATGRIVVVVVCIAEALSEACCIGPQRDRVVGALDAGGLVVGVGGGVVEAHLARNGEPGRAPEATRAGGRHDALHHRLLWRR